MPQLRADPGREPDAGRRLLPRGRPAPRATAIGRQNRRFLDYCEAQGFEVATTFAEEGKAPAAAFAQLIDYLKRPEKGFIVVVVPEPATLADDAVVAAARCLQIERLGARSSSSTPTATKAMLSAPSSRSGRSARRRQRARRCATRCTARPSAAKSSAGRPTATRSAPRNRLELVDDEAVVVRYIYRLYLQEGLGIRLIARRLNEEGLRTRRNRPWSMVSIRDILRNRAYLGTYQRLGVRVPGTHPALVSPDDFRQRPGAPAATAAPTTRRARSAASCSPASCICAHLRQPHDRRQPRASPGRAAATAASRSRPTATTSANRAPTRASAPTTPSAPTSSRRRCASSSPSSTRGSSRPPATTRAVIAQWQAEAQAPARPPPADRPPARPQPRRRAAGKLSGDKLRAQALPVAEERLKVEEELRDAEWRAEHYASAAERRRTRNAALDLLVYRVGDPALDRAPAAPARARSTRYVSATTA